MSTIDVEAAIKSNEYKTYLQASSELEKIDIINLSQHCKVAVFLNIYQAMYVHYFLKRVHEEDPNEA